MSKQVQIKSVGGYPIVAANIGTSKVYSVSNKTVANILHKRGYYKTELIKNVMNKSWYSPADIRALTDIGYADEDISIVMHECKSVAKKVSEFFLSSRAEGSVEQRMADTADYWNKFAGKFGKEFMNIRAVKHDGQILFLVDDIAKIYGGSYANGSIGLDLFSRKVLSNHVKSYGIKKLSYSEILEASPNSVNDARSFRRGKQFLEEEAMLFVLQQSKSPAAVQYRLHLIDVLKGRAKNMLEHEEEQIEQRAKGTKERENNIDLNKRFTESCARKKLVTRIMQGEINRSVLGMTKAEYMTKNKIVEPFNDNASVHVVNTKNIALSISIGDLDAHQEATIKNKEGKAICFAAGSVARVMMTSKSARAQIDAIARKELALNN
jgi:prophage antirepressor-like protein